MKQEIQTEWNSACRKKYTYGQISRTSKVRENLRYCKLTHKEGPVVMAVWQPKGRLAGSWWVLPRCRSSSRGWRNTCWRFSRRTSCYRQEVELEALGIPSNSVIHKSKTGKTSLLYVLCIIIRWESIWHKAAPVFTFYLLKVHPNLEAVFADAHWRQNMLEHHYEIARVIPPNARLLGTLRQSPILIPSCMPCMFRWCIGHYNLKQWSTNLSDHRPFLLKKYWERSEHAQASD